MKKKYGVVGYGKIGSLLCERDDFVFLSCDVCSLEQIRDSLDGKQLDIIVNCAAKSSIDFCEQFPTLAMDINKRGVQNLHKLFGENVLTISSDHVFSGKSWLLPKETTSPSPVNTYGATKWGAEIASDVNGGKVMRLSRSVGIADQDIVDYLAELWLGNEIHVPNFFSRNYLHKNFVVDGIEYMVRNWDTMPKLVNYAGTENVTMYSFMRLLAIELGIDPYLVQKRAHDDSSLIPRPHKGGLNVDLARSLGFPMYNISETIYKLEAEIAKS